MSRDQDQLLIDRISTGLSHFKEVSSGTFRFICPFCHDGGRHNPTSAPKRKGYLFQAYDQRTVFKCHRCGLTSGLREFVSRINPTALDNIPENSPTEEPYSTQPVNQPAHIIRYQIQALTDLYSQIAQKLATNLRWWFNALDAEDIEDVCGDAWLAVLKYIQQGRCKFVTEDLIWKGAYRLALNAIRDKRRHEKALSQAHSGEHRHCPDTDSQIDVRRLVDALPENHRQVIVAYFWNGKTVPEIATDLGITDKAAQKRLDRTLKAWAKQVKKE
jgi:RNA polymerase sigma factor (sigma-70 family)